MDEETSHMKEKTKYSYAKIVKHGSYKAFKALQELCYQKDCRAALATQVEATVATDDASETTTV